MKKLSMFVASAVFAVGGSIGVGAKPASAHIHDFTNALYACWEQMPFGSIPNTMIHAHPLSLTSSYVRYGCYNYSITGQCVRWEVLLWADRSVWGPLDGSISYSTCPS